MKISASIPDDLWNTTVREGESVSQIVQQALQMLREDRQRHAERLTSVLSYGTGDALDEVDDCLETLIDEARTLRDRGYSIGVEVARSLSWQAIEALPSEGELRYRLGRWAVGHHDDVPFGDVLSDFLEERELLDEDDEPLHSPTLWDGVTQGLEDVRAHVRARLQDAVSSSVKP